MLHRVVRTVKSNLSAFWPISAAVSDGYLTSQIHRLELPLQPDSDTGWKPYWLFAGSTRDRRKLSCHASVLTEGTCPHPPHRHREEEILILLSGQVELLLPSHCGQALVLAPAQFVYYPAGFVHSLRTISRSPANYLMFKWSGRTRNAAQPLAFCHNPVNDKSTEAGNAEFQTRLLLEGPTEYLGKLHSHASTLAPGAGYVPHRDDHDVAIVLLEGEVETLGHRAKPHDVIFYSMADSHGMHNPGALPAKYLVFELHRAPSHSFWHTVGSRIPQKGRLIR